MSVLLLPPFLAVSSVAFTTCFSRFLFLSAILLSPSVSSFSLLLLPRFFRTSHTCSRWLQRFAPQPVLPAPWRPTSTRTSTSLRASCQARSLLAGPRLLPFGGLCQRGVETQAVTPSCPITSSRCAGIASLALALALSPSLSLSPSHSLSRSHSHTHPRSLSLSLAITHSPCATCPTVPPRARTHISCPLTSLTLSLPFFSLLFASSSSSLCLPLCLIFFLHVILSSSSSPPLLLLCVFLLWSSSHLFPLWLIHVGSSHFCLPAQLLGGVDVGSRTKDLSSNVAVLL